MLKLDARTKLLVIAPHPDDEVIGCAGLIHHVKAHGGKVFVLYMTVGTAKDFTNGGSTSHARGRKAEIKRVAKFLSIDDWRIVFTGDKHHLQLDQIPQKKLIHEIERGKRLSLETLRPDILALPPVTDYNQDHRATAQAALTACRPAPAADKFVPPLILSYESPMSAWSPQRIEFQPNFFVKLTPAYMRAKAQSMELYKSQTRGAGHPRNNETLTALARVRGSLIGEHYAEAYYCYKFHVA